MARGLRQLIDHLLNEISLCGAFGASPQDVCRYIKEFYDQASDRPLADASADHAIEGEGDLQPAAAPAQLVDRAFEETVWTWLTQQPEVSVGQNRQGNGLTLSEVEATHGPAAAQGDASARSPYLRQGPPLPVSTAGKRGAVKPSPPPPSSGPPDQASHGLQVYVSSSRMWLAVAGHERDDARVSPLEFTLLSIIAMHKGRGITQPELVRLSGQDKRSVPKRTDGLARAGYIEKKPVLSKSTRTSLCTLRKFVGTAAPASATATAAATAADVAADNDDGSFFDLESFFDRLIEVLQECQVITRADLRDSLGMTGMKRRKVLQRSLGKLVALGCIQKVKATSQYHDILHKKLSSIQLVRVPTAEDRRLFFELSPALVDTRGQGGAEGDGDGDADEEGEDFTTRWSPDRPLYNQLYELIAASGTEGLTNLQLVKSSLGLFYRRPIEAITSRLVESWPSAQPQHLRKFAIVRDLGIRGTISHYVHYTLDNLQQLIREGKASADILDQLIPPSSSKKSGGHAIPPLDAAAELDQYGFPLNETPPAGLVNGGDASLRDCLAAARPVPPNLPPRQPRIVRRRDGTRDVMIERRPNAPPMTRREDRDPERQRPLTKYQRLLKRHEDRPEKEQLEAIGMDMGWTEYAVHVIPRPTPGAYLTPFGKRRATGNARGRPRKSRILIIKSDRLKGQAPAEGAARVSADATGASTDAATGQPQDAVSEGPRAALGHHVRPSERVAEDATREVLSDLQQPTMTEQERVPSKRKREADQPTRAGQPSPSTSGTAPNGSAQQVEEPSDASGVPAKRPRTAASSATSTAKSGPLVPDRVATSNAAAQDPIVKAEPLEPSASPMTTPEFRATDVSAISVASSAATHTAEVKGERTVEVTSGPLRRKHRGAGTVNMLRRGVVMDILAQCQGMCPLGAELWLPFATAWQKQHAVKPDKRTLQATVKQLVDAGKVRQLTFSGRNSRNMMVTRSIIATPDISTQDPRLIDLQQKVLAADPQPYIPANLEIAPDIRKDKQAGNVQPSLRDEPEEVSVLMHRAPLRVLKLQETRRLRTEQGQARLDALLHQRLKRLATTHSRAGTGVAIPLQTIETLERRRKLERWLPRLNALGIDIPGRSTAQRDALLHPPTLPRNLQDVLDIVGPADTTEMKALRSDFFAQIDAVERWELEVLELYASHVSRAPNQWAFINHFAGEAVPTVPMERSPQWAVSAVAPEVPPTRYRRLAVLPAPPTADLVSTVLPKKRRKRTQREQAPRRLASYTRQAAPQKTENRTIAGRRNKGLKAFSHSLKRRLIAALVVLRTLVGGNEGKALDWSYIQLAFPDHDPRSIIPPGKTLLARHRLQIPKLQAEFQERFLIAYEAGEVPPIDYEHLEQYDWAGLVDWVCEELEFSSENALPSLPATRERFDSIFNVQVEPLQQLSEMFQQNAPPTTYRRQQLYASVAFATPLSSVEPSGDDSISQRLQAARTWVRASVITSDENFDAKAAEAMLAHIEPALLSQAKEALAKEGAIHHKNKGRFVPGRSYDLTENFIHTLGKRRHIESTQLTQAATFKQNVLDPELRTRGRYTVKYDAEDGDVLAVINMMQAGRVTIHPVNPPRDKYGLTDGGYLTRLMDKGKLRFDVEVKPVESRYIYGNPLEDKKHSIPRGEMPDDFPASATEHEPCRIPLWFDVHGNFVRLLWDSAAAAVAGLLAARPGMTSVDVAQMLRPCLEVWEVALVVEFMLGLGIVEDRAGDHQQPATAEAAMHWYLKEWWWMMLAAEPQP